MKKVKNTEKYELYDGHSELGYLSYNCRQCSKALDDNKITLAKKIFYDLNEKFPDDDYVKLLNFRINFFERNFDYCKDIFESINNKPHYLISGLSLYIFLRDYDTILRVYFSYMYNKENPYDGNPDYFMTNVYYRMKIFIEKTFQMRDSKGIPKNSYSILQQLNYSEDLALEHIITRHGMYAPDDCSKFREDIDLLDLFQNIKTLILENPDKRFISKLQERYLIHYTNAGYSPDRDSVMLNYIVVGVNYVSNDIITMFPSLELGIDVPVIEYNSLFIKDEDVKCKTLSRIDKFNNKYKIY